MPRSFAWAVGWRIAAALLAAAVLWHWLVAPWQQALSGLVLAVLATVSFRGALETALCSLEDNIRARGEDTHPASPAGASQCAHETVPNELRPLRSALHEDHQRQQAREHNSLEERQKLEGILDSMPEAVAALDAGGRLLWMNGAMRQLLPETGNGRDSPNRLGHALVHVVRDPDVLAATATALEGQSPDPRRARTVLPGRTFDVNAAPMPSGGAVVILRDVTPAEQMERTQRDFVANVSHELRTPLTSITGYVQTLLEEIEDEALQPNRHAPAATSGDLQQEFLGTILRNAERMNLLIDDLLELSRVESGEHPVHPIAVSAASLVEEALSATVALLPEDGSARLERGELSEASVLADPDATIRVLTNLLENALKYGRGHSETRVAVSVTDGLRAGTLCFSVRDWGAGIASEHQGRLFERFYRVDKARSRESGGTGLGLAIARGLINAQGGEIWCESELGRGSTFRFTLPLASCQLPFPSEESSEQSSVS